MKVGVVGLGYVGAVTAACLARDGHAVLGIDVDPAKVELIRSGRAPIVEDSIQEITAAAVESGHLQVAQGVDGRIADMDIIFVCVGTPSAANGAQNLDAVRRVSAEIGREFRSASGFPVIVFRSTIFPGTTQTIVQPIVEESSGKSAGVEFGLCFQPEFLREGTSVKDFDHPPFTIVGSSTEKETSIVRELFGNLPGEFLETDIRTAEMLKLACNAFHTLKISFANEIGRLGQSLGVDARDVMQLLAKDTKLNISKAYLRPGFAYGGSCLPKDLRTMTYLAKTNDVEVPVLQGLGPSNVLHIEHAARLVMDQPSRKVGFIGLSFKPGTDDLRESPLVTLAERLIGKGYELRIYDPGVSIARLLGANERFIRETIPHIESLLCTDIQDVFEHADTLVVGYHDAAVLESLSGSVTDAQTIVDLSGVPDPDSLTARYQGICW